MDIKPIIIVDNYLVGAPPPVPPVSKVAPCLDAGVGGDPFEAAMLSQ